MKKYIFIISFSLLFVLIFSITTFACATENTDIWAYYGMSYEDYKAVLDESIANGSNSQYYHKENDLYYSSRNQKSPSEFANTNAQSWDCSCGANDNTGNYCPFCGNESPFWICPNCETVNQYNYCIHCGTANPSENRVNDIQEDISEYNTIYLNAIALAEEKKDYDSAINLLMPLAEQNYKDSRSRIAGFILSYTENTSDTDKPDAYIKACNMLKELKAKNYGEADTPLKTLYSKMLGKGKYAYYTGKYDIAKKYLKFLESNNSTSESKLYYTLSCVRSGDYFSRATYNLLMNHFNEADTKKALVCKQLAAKWFLTGTWKNSNGYQLIFDDLLSDNMPSVLPGEKRYWIEDGTVYVYADKLRDRQQDKKITVIDQNTIEVYCYDDGKTYILERANDF